MPLGAVTTSATPINMPSAEIFKTLSYATSSHGSNAQAPRKVNARWKAKIHTILKLSTIFINLR